MKPITAIHSFSLLLLLCCSLSVWADKIEKKGTFLNSACKPIGTNCKSIDAAIITTLYVYNEPQTGSFCLQFKQEEVMRYPELNAMLSQKSEINLNEDMPLPADIITALKMPPNYVISKGIYPVKLRNGWYCIQFK